MKKLTSFKDFITEVSQDDMIDALYAGVQDDNFIDSMYDWFQDNYPDAPIYAGDAVPDDFIELLDNEGDKKMITKIYKDMVKKHKKVMNEAKIEWYSSHEGGMCRDGSGHAEMNVYFEKGEYFGYGKNKHGDVDARGFGGTKDLKAAANEMIKAFKLNSYHSGMAEYILTKAKEVEGGAKDIELSKAEIEDNASF